MMEISTGSLVSEIASNGKAVIAKPSAKLEKMLADQSRLNGEPRLMSSTLSWNFLLDVRLSP
jgi:hypothetical protein